MLKVYKSTTFMIKGFEDFYVIYSLKRQNVATTEMQGVYPSIRRKEVKTCFDKSERLLKLLKIKVQV